MKLTPARRHALSVLLAHGGRARRSNETDDRVGYVYWQSADWMIAEGLARLDGDDLELVVDPQTARELVA